MRLRYTDQAKTDIESAFSWYEQQRRGLGFDFLGCVEVVIENIQQMPRLYATHHDQFRRALVRRFPFSIFYSFEQEEIIVHAVFDTRQDPANLP
jgi:plasmid stabilization system protein ParE